MLSNGFVREKISKGYSPDLLPSIAARRLARLRASQPPSIESFWTPNPGPQEQFYHSNCREILYGGAAGGGKSEALTALGLRYSHLPGCNIITFRRDATQFDDLIGKSTALFRKAYPGLSPVYSPHFKWKFPSGAVANYRHMQHEKDAAKYDGWEINLLCFDELTHFLEKQYLALCARVRSADPSLPTLIRATTNPGGVGHDWVFRRWGAWLDPEFEGVGLEERRDPAGNKLPPALPGEIWWIRTGPDGKETYFRDDPGPDVDGTPALSRTFIPAKLEDNPHLAKNDPAYVGTLNSLDPVRRAQLKGGDWLIKPAAGKYFKRTWTRIVERERVPELVKVCRAWDLAGTEKKDAKDDPDWTVGGLFGLSVDDLVYVIDIVRIRGTPGRVVELIKETAELDGTKVTIVLPQDPGQAGKAQVYSLKKELRGFIVKSKPVTGDKITRFSPFSSYAEGPTENEPGLVRIVRGAWNMDYIAELEAFPEDNHDDQVDATSDGFKFVSRQNKMLQALRARS